MRAEQATYDPFSGSVADDPRLIDGATFVLTAPEKIPALWGEEGGRVLWPEGEGFMICGTQGVGKSTIAQQLMLCRQGIRSGNLLGLPVRRAERPTLYLAMDRPQQIARSLRRMVTDEDKELLRDRIIAWKGPLPFNITKDVRALASFAEDLGVEDVIADSYKDLAPGLTGDEVGAQVNLAVQELVVRGMQWLGLHHQRKASADNKRPNTLDDVYGSNWLTAGLGSVALLWGKPGSQAVELIHLKQPAEPVGPLEFRHDHMEGTSQSRNLEGDLVQFLLRQGEKGCTEAEAAMLLFSDDDSASKKKASRRLDALVAGNCARHEPGTRGGSGGGGRAARWWLK